METPIPPLIVAIHLQSNNQMRAWLCQCILVVQPLIPTYCIARLAK